MAYSRSPLSAGTKRGITEFTEFFGKLGQAGFKAEVMILAANDTYVIDAHRGFSTAEDENIDLNWILLIKLKTVRSNAFKIFQVIYTPLTLSLTHFLLSNGRTIMSQVLIISGHPDLNASYTNTVILEQIQSNLSDVEVRRLDNLYPDYRIDVVAEQQAMLAADVIVLQFYSIGTVPALMKKWIDDVFSFNFAYGPEGDKLKGKDFILSFTVGGPAESYDPLGYNHFTVEQMIHPLQQTAYLAGMNYCQPIYTHRMVYIPNVYNELEDVQARAKNHAERLCSQISELLTSPTTRINKFITEWFARFDVLPEDNDFFTRHLARDLTLSMPEGQFLGHEGFVTVSNCTRNI